MNESGHVALAAEELTLSFMPRTRGVSCTTVIEGYKNKCAINEERQLEFIYKIAERHWTELGSGIGDIPEKHDADVIFLFEMMKKLLH